MGASDDLDAPLRGRPHHRRRPSLVWLVLAALALAALAAFAFVLLAEDPSGGEPVATATIERRLAPPPHSPPAPKPDEPRLHAGVTVVAPGDPMPQSGPVIIRLPGADAPAAADGPGAPIPSLIEQTRFGPLPRIAPDGTRPSARYARPAPAAAGPRVAILVAAADAVPQTLPAEVTLAFQADAADLGDRLAAARAAGHETMLLAPLEDFSGATRPDMLLTGLPPEANLERLRALMGRGTGYVGIAALGGGRFLAAEPALSPVLVEIGRRGLVFVDAGEAPGSRAAALAAESGLPAIVAETVVRGAEPATVDAELARLERTALAGGPALGVFPPAAAERIAAWAAGLAARGITLVPASALALQPAAAVAGAR